MFLGTATTYNSKVSKYFNGMYPCISLTMERETKKVNTIIDMLEIRIDNGTLEYHVYQKPTLRDRYFHKDFNHYLTEKRRSLKVLAHSVMRICKTEPLTNRGIKTFVGSLTSQLIECWNNTNTTLAKKKCEYQLRNKTFLRLCIIAIS